MIEQGKRIESVSDDGQERRASRIVISAEDACEVDRKAWPKLGCAASSTSSLFLRWINAFFVCLFWPRRTPLCFKEIIHLPPTLQRARL